MRGYLLDTDHLTLHSREHPAIAANLAKHPEEAFICAISAEEQMLGWFTALRRTRDRKQIEITYERMAKEIKNLARWRIASFSVGAMTLHDGLKRLRLNIGSNDLKIAAIALNEDATVVTRNTRDFSRVPGLSIVDWSV